MISPSPKRRLDAFVLSLGGIAVVAIAATASLRFVAALSDIRLIHAYLLLGSTALVAAYGVKLLIGMSQAGAPVRLRQPDRAGPTVVHRVVGAVVFVAAVAAVALTAGFAFAALPDRFVQLAVAAAVGAPSYALLLSRYPVMSFGDAVPTSSSLRRALGTSGLQCGLAGCEIANLCMSGRTSPLDGVLADVFIALFVFSVTMAGAILRRILDALPADG